MPLYTFYLHERTDVMPRFEIEFLDDPELAVDHARALLSDRPHYSAVTVTEGEIEIARVLREAA